MIHSVFSSRDFERVDDDNDAQFYAAPRLVVHIDQQAVSTVSELLAQLVPCKAEILDLMSSWRSHLPAGLEPRRVVGLGMNGVEMAENEQLSEYLVHNLNKQPQLPFPSASFDATLNIVSVQYLTQPVEVFREVRRVLRPGGRYIVVFSNRMFPTKAVRIWRESEEAQRVDLVRRYFEDSGGWEGLQALERNVPGSGTEHRLSWLGLSGDPIWVVTATRAQNIS